MTTTRAGAAQQRQRKLYLDLIGVTDGTTLRRLLADYEATGDHDHGRGPIAPGGPCGMGDDCWVRRARAVLAAIDALSDHDYYPPPQKETAP